MSLILSGTDGLSDVDGSAATPAIRGTDANTGIFFPAADTIAFAEGGAEVARFDSSGNFGLGVTPSYRLDVSKATAGDVARFTNGGASNKSLFVYTDATYAAIATGVGASGNGIALDAVTNKMLFTTASTNQMALDASGNLGVGTTSPANYAGYKTLTINGASTGGEIDLQAAGTQVGFWASSNSSTGFGSTVSAPVIFYTNGSERARIDSSGSFIFGKTSSDSTVSGAYFNPAASGFFHLVITNTTATSTNSTMYLNRQSSDGRLIEFRQADTAEGDISVSGTTVSYNGGHLSRWAQTTSAKDDAIVKGTVLSNLDEMNVYTDAEGRPVDNEQLNKVKVSDTEGDANVAGVFVNWSHDDAHDVDEINMAMTGDMIIRIAQGVTVARGDLLMSAGDGTAKPQGDDIVRSKTVAKVTSTHVTCTYADGSYCVPCVLMAC
jgi:hypothetical protein